MSDLKRSDRPDSSSRRRMNRGAAVAAAATKDQSLQEKVVHINRCAKVVKGGRRFGFSALVVVGNKEGRVGVGYGKAKEVPDAIKKGTEKAKRSMVSFPIKENTIPHTSIGVADGGRVILRPASPGTGIIAGGGVRAVLETLGVRDVLTKSLGSKNPASVVRATIRALQKMKTYDKVHSIRMAVGDA
jgi:small subunit ribosomal protein S5